MDFVFEKTAILSEGGIVGPVAQEGALSAPGVYHPVRKSPFK
jgi:hypothetical protein